MKLFSILSLGSVGAYNAGGCNDDQYTSGNDMRCKNECDVTNVGRGPKIKYANLMVSEQTFLSKAQVPGMKKKNYIGLLRYDSKFCSDEVLQAINDRKLRIDVGDKSQNAYVVESATYSVPASSDVGGKDAAMVQFRRKGNQKGDQIAGGTRDVIYIQASGMEDLNESHENVKTCIDNVLIATMADDKIDNFKADYTKCALWSRYGMEPDWSEIAPDTTVQPELTTGPDDGDNLIPDNVRCQSSTISKIVNGDDVVKNSWPWIVGVVQGSGNWHMCGGTILNSNHVLTAAHCCDGFSGGQLKVAVGDHNNQINDGEQLYTANKVIMHPKYGESDGYTYNYDVCILETDDMELDKNRKDIACLPRQGEHVNPTSIVRSGVSGDRCYVGGWGTTSSGGGLSAILQSVKVDIFSAEFCQAESSYGNSFDPASEFCAGKMEGGIDSCQGDSGGPLICIDRHNQPVLYGVVSWGYGCAFSGYPGIYAKTAAVIDWVEQTVGVTSEPDDEDEDNVVFQTGPAHLPNDITAGCNNNNPGLSVEEGGLGPRILGGSTVDADNGWKFMARITIDGDHYCGGSIVSNTHIVTAGSCCNEMTIDMMQVVIGDWTSAKVDPGEFTVNPEAIFLHENYDEGFRGSQKAISNNICILKVPDLSKEAPNNCKGCFESVCLPTMHAEYGEYCWAAGWGKFGTGSNSKKLRDVGVNIMGPKYCDAKSEYDGTVNHNVEFCAGTPDNNGDGVTDSGADTCGGDEGGPLVCLVNNQAVLYGITSWGTGCGQVGFPGVYTKVAALHDWINNVITNNGIIN